MAMALKLEDYFFEDIVTIMQGLFSKGKVLKDYKCVGNTYGSTIILRLHDPNHEPIQQFPLGKSPSRQARDNTRYDQYMSKGTSPYSPLSAGEISDLDLQQNQPKSTVSKVTFNTVDVSTTTNENEVYERGQVTDVKCDSPPLLSACAEPFIPLSMNSIVMQSVMNSKCLNEKCGLDTKESNSDMESSDDGESLNTIYMLMIQ